MRAKQRCENCGKKITVTKKLAGQPVWCNRSACDAAFAKHVREMETADA